MNVSLCAVVLFTFFCNFCLNSDRFLLKYFKIANDSLVEFTFQDKRKLMNSLNQLFWQSFLLSFLKFSISFFIKMTSNMPIWSILFSLPTSKLLTQSSFFEIWANFASDCSESFLAIQFLLSFPNLNRLSCISPNIIY